MTTAGKAGKCPECAFTEQEFQVMFAVCMGLSNQEIAEQCRIGEDTVQRTILQHLRQAWSVDANRVCICLSGPQ